MESPWGSNNKPNPNDNEFDNLLKASQKKFEKYLNFKNNNKTIFTALIVIFILWLSSGFYNVGQEEQAVVLRFGKYVRVALPGLNYHIPEPFEKVTKHKVTRAEKEEIGFRSGGSSETIFNQRSIASTHRTMPEESLMLTGDENIIDINCTVQWNIKNIKDFVFNIYNPKETVKSAAESVMREITGNTPFMTINEDRAPIEQAAKQLLQTILDSYHSGIEIISFSVPYAEPPVEVIDAFRDVQTARADKEREINQGLAYQNDIIPRARGEAARITQDAEAYQQEVVAIATGEVSRFSAIYNQYKLARDVTKKRLYLETMEEVLKNMDKIIIDRTLDKSVLPYLPLPQLNKTN